MANQNREKEIEEKKSLRREIRSRMLGYIIGALGLVAGLAWNEAIRHLIDLVFPLDKNSIWAKFIYAIIITVVVVWISMSLMKFADKTDNKK